jgi:prepilin-type processing-associated H-X9-DG protein
MISSWHTNGAHIAMADGSVRFIETNTDPELLRKLITKSGEEEIEEW